MFLNSGEWNKEIVYDTEVLRLVPTIEVVCDGESTRDIFYEIISKRIRITDNK